MNSNQHDLALELIDALMVAKQGTQAGQILNLLSELVEVYEDEHYPIELPTPEVAAEFRRDQESA